MHPNNWGLRQRLSLTAKLVVQNWGDYVGVTRIRIHLYKFDE